MGEKGKEANNKSRVDLDLSSTFKVMTYAAGKKYHECQLLLLAIILFHLKETRVRVCGWYTDYERNTELLSFSNSGSRDPDDDDVN